MPCDGAGVILYIERFCMTIRDPGHRGSPGRHGLSPTTASGRLSLRALGASALLMVAGTVVLNTVGQSLASTLLGGASAAFALACFVFAGVAVIRDGERSPFVYGAAVIAGLLLAVLLHSLFISD